MPAAGLQAVPRALPAAEAEAVRELACTVLRSRAEFDALEAEWNDLFARGGRGAHVFQTFNWNWHWANHYIDAPGCNCTLAIVTVRRQERLVALWPLMLVHRFGLRVAKWIGEPVSQYGDALIDPREDLAAILERSWHAITHDLDAHALHLRKVRADAHALPLIVKAGAVTTAQEEAPYLDLASAPDFAAYEERYSAKARKNRRRLSRRLAALGSVSTLTHTGGSAARAAATEAIALKLQSLAATGRISPALADARYAAFFADAADGGAHPSGCRVSQMKVGDDVVASCIDVSSHTHRAAHLIVHDPRFDACGPGALMAEHWVRTASDEGMAVFDFLAPAHAYKWEWADDAVAVNDYAVATSAVGILIVKGYFAVLRPRLKSAVEHAIRLKAAAHALLQGRRPPRSCSGVPHAGS